LPKSSQSPRVKFSRPRSCTTRLGGSSKAHYHDADVFAFVLSGKILSAEEGDEAKVYNVGEGHFERRGQHHVVSKNASMTEPASMLVVFISDAGAKLTTFDH
jgi:quercetin dioxygenase-like cupin family protein